MVKKYWFLIALLAVIIGSFAVRNRIAPSAAAAADAFVKPVCIAGIFFVSGLVLRPAEIGAAILQWRLHGFVQGVNLVVMPAVFYAASRLLARMGASSELCTGFVVLGCLPTTITSCVALTRVAGGNQAAALCNATIGNMAGIAVTPALLFLLLGKAAPADAAAVVRRLTVQVLVPVAVGQVVGIPSTAFFKGFKKPLGTLNQMLLLVLLLFVFLKAFQSGFGVSAATAAVVIAVIATLRLFFLVLAWYVSGPAVCNFDRSDRIAAIFCGTQKTIALGIPVIAIMFAASPAVGLVSFPLVCYHPIQLLVDGFLADCLARNPSAPQT